MQQIHLYISGTVSNLNCLSLLRLWEHCPFFNRVYLCNMLAKAKACAHCTWENTEL